MNGLEKELLESILTGPFPVLGVGEIPYFMLPAFRHFGHGTFHQHTVNGRFDPDRMVADLGARVVRSESRAKPDTQDGPQHTVKRLLARLEENTWALCDDDSILTVAADPERARHQATDLANRFSLPPLPEEPRFYILSVRRGDLHAEAVKVEQPSPLHDEDLVLHYGPDFPSWEASLTARLSERPTGIALLRGEPGTGKTSFIRRLMGTLQSTHRFYYLPVAMAGLLSSPETAEFWLGQNNRRDKRRNIVILEDAESLLEERTGQTRSSLESFLNVSDGLMGEFLKTLIIATINCQVSKLDPAITRPGRLLAYRNFGRLPAEQARLLAERKGLRLPDQPDYSLAEIYNGAPVESREFNPRAIGFAA